MLVLGLLLFTLTVGSVGIGFVIQQNPFIRGIDNYFYELFVQHFHNHYLDLLIAPFNFNWVTWLGPMPTYLYVEVLAGLICLYFYQRKMLGYAIYSIIVGSLMAYLITYLDWKFVFRERPFLSLPAQIDLVGYSAWAKLSSYPSGHARETALYSTILANYIPRLRWPLIFFVIFIGLSRAYLGAHYPTDILAGILIGYLAAKFSLITAREVQILIDKKKGTDHEEKPKV